jgi:hypothetical protein
MLTLRQYQVLNACADGWELFYFPFAEVNYGGQVFPRDAGAIYGEFGTAYAQYVDEGPWTRTVAAEDVVSDVCELLQRGLLGCEKTRPDLPCEVLRPWEEEFSCYAGYSCLTFEEHIEHFGYYGPHEFKATHRGIVEMKDPRYQVYDAQLGWLE